MVSSNSDNDIGTSNFTHSNVQNDSSLNTLINLQKVMDKEPNVSINYEKTDQNHIGEDISSHQNPAEIIDHAYDDSGINLVNTEDEVHFTCIRYKNKTNDISKNYDVKSPINTMHHFYRQITTKIYFQEQNMIQKNAEFVVIK